jgi:hypothetical protein
MGYFAWEKSMRYRIDEKAVLILDQETGRTQHPVCWQDLFAYYCYLVGRGRVEESQTLLEESMAGRKPITRMLAQGSER